MAGGRLISTKRRVGDADVRRYAQAWEDVRSAAGEAGARAWRFQSARDPSLFVEFLEFGGAEDPRQRPTVAGALERLQEFGPEDTEEWLDASPKPT